jgi:hypothetical protein
VFGKRKSTQTPRRQFWALPPRPLDILGTPGAVPRDFEPSGPAKVYEDEIDPAWTDAEDEAPE